MLELDCFVRSWLFYCCPLSYIYICELCWNSRIWPLVLNSLVSCKSELWLHVQFHMHYVAISLWTCGIAFFWFWLLASECPYWRRFAYYCKKDVEVAYYSAWGRFTCLSLSPLVLLGLVLFFLASVPHISLSIKKCVVCPDPTRLKNVTSFTLYALICKYM